MSTVFSSAPPSILCPTFSTVAAPCLPKTLLYPSDIETSVAAYEELLESAKAYRNQLAALSQSANRFGTALEVCSRTKGVDEAAEGLSNVAGLQYLLANHQSVLSDTIYRSFEIPLRENLENFIDTTAQRREEYKINLAARMKLLAKREKEHLALAQKKQRSLSKFREALADLTRLADEIDKLKSDYFYSALDYHCETWSRVALRSNIICKAELAIYAGVAQKADHLDWSLVGTPDPWTQDARCGDEIFHIVPPQDILARPQSPGHDNNSGLFQSLLGALDELEPSGLNTMSAQQTLPDHSKHASLKFSSSRNRSSSDMTVVSPWLDVTTAAGNVISDSTGAETSPASPYQDAEEEQEQEECATTHSTLSKDSARYASRETPSRPSSSSRRSNAHLTLTPSRSRPQSAQEHLTPRPISSRVLGAESGSGISSKRLARDLSTLYVEQESPESDNGQKCSEFEHVVA